MGEILPDGRIQGYACANCGEESGFYGHMSKDGWTCKPDTPVTPPSPAPISTLPPVLSDDTKKALRRAGRKVKDATVERDELIKRAVEEGGSLREVGDAVGLSHQAVKFIAHGRPK